jgi:hypothetical protein
MVSRFADEIHRLAYLVGVEVQDLQAFKGCGTREGHIGLTWYGLSAQAREREEKNYAFLENLREVYFHPLKCLTL